MKAIFYDRQRLHDPQHFMANGKTYPSPESPERITRLMAGATICQFQPPQDAGPEVIPNIPPAKGSENCAKSAIGQAGYHQADTACPIGARIWDAAYWSARSAITGADLVAGGARAVYVLSRRRGPKPLPNSRGGILFPEQFRHRRCTVARARVAACLW